MLILVFLILSVGLIGGPPHLHRDQLQSSIGLDTLSSQQEREIVRHAVLVLASHELNQLGSLFTKGEGVDLLNLISLLNFGSRSDLCLLDLYEMKFSKVFLAANADILLTVLGYFRGIFLHHLGFNEKEETHQGCITRRR